MYQAGEAASTTSNDARAWRMAAIAFTNFNIAIACLYGSFSVVLGAVQARFGINNELATLAMPAVAVVSALSGLMIGILAPRVSIRLMLLAGSICGVAAYTILAFTHSFSMYLVGYGLLLGPAVGAGTVLPATLVTRWFISGRGKALGIVCTTFGIALTPLISNWMLLSHGLTATYLTMAAISAISVIANVFVVDFPPGAQAGTHAVDTSTDQPVTGVPMSQLIRSGRFWAMVLAYCVASMGAITLGSHLVPMALSWGFSATFGATLLTVSAVAAMLGSNLFGWIADRLGGPLSLVIIVFDSAVLWLLLLTHPSPIIAAIIIGVLGMHSGGLTPVLGLAFSQVFGTESFSRAYGLTNFIFLPFSAGCVPAAAVIFTRTGSYSDVLLCEAVLLGLTTVLALTARRRNVAAPA